MALAVEQSINTSNVLCVILGGGAGKRLFPLTRDRAKPAVPLAGKYRLVDVPISNCINSNFRRIYLLTQYNSVSLHRHILQSYNFDPFSGGFVEILAAEQTPTDSSWYQGTADAVRKNLVHFMHHDFEYLLILSGDQLYRMDFRDVIAQHVETGAEVTIATKPVQRTEAPQLGIMQIDDDRRIRRFVEKPTDPRLLDEVRLPEESLSVLGIKDAREAYLASMGIYVFNRDILRPLLANDLTDFGKHVIPMAIQKYRVFAYVFQGYWEDIGTIRSFFEANLDAASELPKFNFYDMTAPIFTRARFLPSSKVNSAHIERALISEGCIINGARIVDSVIGLRSIVESGSYLRRVVAMGCDYYETPESVEASIRSGRPRIGIGKNTHIENAIIDKNARIGDNVVITPEGKPENLDHELYYIRDGIVIIPRDGVVPHGTII
ncbi:MAG: glucose-1-phosphate adenylyltransferase [Verrucomicrobiae bacterium]|nr:glucose-1-phosphate adenylyltransferase [Verrucomicrobiae bacterium]